MPRSKIEQWSGRHANVDNILPVAKIARIRAALIRGLDVLPSHPTISACSPICSSDCANCACDTGYYCVGKLVLCVTADVIGAKYMLRESTLLVRGNFCVARKKRFKCGVV